MPHSSVIFAKLSVDKKPGRNANCGTSEKLDPDFYMTLSNNDT